MFWVDTMTIKYPNVITVDYVLASTFKKDREDLNSTEGIS